MMLLSFGHFWCAGKQVLSVCRPDSSCLVDDWCWCLMVRVWLIASVIVQIAYPLMSRSHRIDRFVAIDTSLRGVICAWRSELKGHDPSRKEKKTVGEWGKMNDRSGVEAAAVFGVGGAFIQFIHSLCKVNEHILAYTLIHKNANTKDNSFKFSQLHSFNNTFMDTHSVTCKCTHLKIQYTYFHTQIHIHSRSATHTHRWISACLRKDECETEVHVCYYFIIRSADAVRSHTHTLPACSDDCCGYYLYKLATAKYLRQTIAFQAAFSIQLRFVQTLMVRHESCDSSDS